MKKTVQYFSQIPNKRKRLFFNKSQLSKWNKQYPLLLQQNEVRSTCKKLHSGSRARFTDVDEELMQWVITRRSLEIPVLPAHIIAKACSINAGFAEIGRKTQESLIRRFMQRNNLSIRAVTHTGQIPQPDIHKYRIRFALKLNEKWDEGGIYHNISAKYFVNMDQSAIYYESRPRTTVHLKGEKTISIKSSSGSNHRATICLAVAMDGTKLPPFIIFKAQPGGRIESNISKYLPTGVYGCVQAKAWTDEEVMRLWAEYIWFPYIKDTNNSVLMLDDFKCHKQDSFTFIMNSVGTYIELIDGGYTSKVQPIDVGIAKPFKDSLREDYISWMSVIIDSIEVDQPFPCPSRLEIATWASKAWSKITPRSVTKTFEKIGFEI